MKIYTKVVIDIETGVQLEEESFEYKGPLSEALGGGGEGQTGKVDYPPYMKTWHNRMLQRNWNIINGEIGTAPATFMYDPRVWFGFATPTTPVLTTLQSYINFNPETTFAAYTGPTNLGYSRLTTRQSLIDGLYSDMVSGTEISIALDTIIDTFTAKLLAKYTSDVLPKIELGFRDAGAAIGTSFTIARAIAMRDYNREVSDFSAKMHIHFHDVKMTALGQLQALEASWMVHLLNFGVERTRLSADILKTKGALAHDVSGALVMAMGKYSALQSEDSLKRKNYKLDLLDHMNKALSSIAGVGRVEKGESTTAAIFKGAVGGALTGASAGAAGGLPGSAIGAGIGGILGAVKGLLG